MIAIPLKKLVEILDAQLIGDNLIDTQILSVSTNSRKINHQCLFIALKGERFDAHDFAQKAIDNGAIALVVSRPLDFAIPQILVKDTRIALGLIAKWVREQSSARVVALTGSSGKTSVKEMTASILQQCGSVLSTRGNLNNDIGVPLTLLELTPEHQFAVVELGANHAGEIAYTVGLVKPESALINNFAAAHLEGFGSLEGVAQAKGEIFAGLTSGGTAIINADSQTESLWQKNLADKHIWRFSSEQTKQIDFYATNVELTHSGTDFILHSPQGEIAINLPVLGKHNIANALAASALAMSVGASLAAIQRGLKQLKAVQGRLFPLYLDEHKLLLDDTYNANVGSMIAAINVLSEMPGYKILVVGDMGELGKDSEDCHRQVGLAAKNSQIDRVLSVGLLSETISQVSEKGEHFVDKITLTEHLNQLLLKHQIITILVKGSRSAAMEQVVQRIQEITQC